jgi:excisionase family DNA binding protein
VQKEHEPTTMQRLVSLGSRRHIGLSPHTVYTMVSQRRIPFVKMGRLVKFDLELLDKWIKQETVMPMPLRSHS